MLDEEILSQIRVKPHISTAYIMRKYHYTYCKAVQIVAMWQSVQPIPERVPIYKKEGKKLRKSKWNINGKLYENYNQWKEAMND